MSRAAAIAPTPETRAGEAAVAPAEARDAALARAGFAGIARALGLPAEPRLVRIDAAGLDALGARGRAAGGVAQLHPGHFDPGAPRGRALLAHELAHLAQARAPGRPLRRAALHLAEGEARAAGARVAEGLLPRRPALRVAAEAVLLDDALDDALAGRHAREVARIRRLLRGWLGFLWITDGMMRELFTLLVGLPEVSIRAIVGALEEDERETLLDNVSPRHFARFRREILWCFTMVEDRVIADQDERLFEGMSFSGMTPPEVVAIGMIADKGFPERAWSRLRADPVEGPHVAELLDGELRRRAGERFELARAEAEAGQALAAEAEARAAALAAVAEGDARATVERIRALLAERPGDAARIEALDLLSGLLGDPARFAGTVESLQPPAAETDLLDVLLRDFPVRALLDPVGTGGAAGGHGRMETLLRVAEFRPVSANLLLAEDLLAEVWIFNRVSSEEAFLAFQLVKALPDDVRAGFLAEEGGRWAALIYGNMSQSMREAAGMNFYRGGEGRLDLASIQSQLLEDDLWSGASIGRLAGLARMAVAAGEHEWLFNRSREVAEALPDAYADRDVQAQVVEAFRLYSAAPQDGEPRLRWRREYMDWATASVWQLIGHAASFVANSRDGGGLIAGALFGRSLGGEGLDAVSLQNLMGGSFLGVRFMSREALRADPELGAAAAKAERSEAGVNYIDSARWDTDRGVIQVRASDLAIAAIRYPLGDMTVQTGRGRLKGLNLDLSYPTRDTGARPTNMRLAIGELDLADMLIVQRASMLGINRVRLRDLTVRLGADAIAGRREDPETGFDPRTLFPLTPILRLIGLTSRLGRGGAEIARALTEPTSPSPLIVDVGSLSVEGVTTSGGQYIENLTIEDVRFGLSGDVEDHLRILEGSIEANRTNAGRLADQIGALPPGEARERLQARHVRLVARIEALVALQGEVAEALAVTREVGAQREAGEADRARLAAAEATLAPFRRGGVTVDVGRLHVGGMRGRVSSGAIELTDLHGRGTSSAGLLAFLTDSEALNRIAQGQAHRPATAPALSREQGDFELELGDVELNDVRVSEGIPTIEDAEERARSAREALARRTWDPALQSAAADAEQRLEQTREYRRLAAVGATHLSRQDARRMAALGQALVAREAFYAHRVTATGARLGFGADGRTVRLSADELRASRPTEGEGPAVRVGGVAIGGAEGRGVTLTIGIEGGLRSLDRVMERLERVGIKGASLTLLDVAHRDSGITVDRAEARDFDLDLDAPGGVLTATAASLGAEGVRGRVSREWVEARMAELEAKPPGMRTPADAASLEELRESLDMIDGFERLLADLDREIAEAPTEAEVARLRAERESAVALFLQWERRLGARSVTVEGLGARISGLGDLPANAFDVEAALERGIVVEGTGASATRRNDRIFGRLTATDARFGAVEAQSVAAGETSGRFELSRSHVGARNVAIASLALGGFMMQSRDEAPAARGGGQVVTQIFSNGVSTATDVAVDADLDFVPTAQDPEQHRLSGIRLTSLVIGRLEGRGLGFASTHNPPDPLAQDPEGRYQSKIFSIEDGAILGLRAEQMTIAIPADREAAMTISGRASIDSLSGVRVTAFVEDALGYGSARLDGGRIGFRFLEQGGQIFELGEEVTDAQGRVRREGGLRVSEGDFRLPSGSVEARTGVITGRIRHDGDVTTLEGVRIESVTLQRFHIRAGARRFEAEEPLGLTGIAVDAAVNTAVEGDPRVTITRLGIARVAGDHLHVVWPPYDVTIRPDAAQEARIAEVDDAPASALQVENLRVEGLAWSMRGGLAAARGAERAATHADRVHAAFDLLGADLDLDVALDAEDIDFDIMRDGTQVLDIGDLDATARGSAFGAELDATLSDVVTGPVVIGEDAVDIPSLSIPTLEIDRLSFSGSTLAIEAPASSGRIVMSGVEASLRIGLPAPGSATPVDRVDIFSLVVPTTTMRGMTLTLPGAAMGRDLIVRVDPAQEVTLTGLRLGGRGTEPSFVIRPDPARSGGWLTDGHVAFGRAEGQQLAVEIRNMLQVTTDFTASGFDLDLFATGGKAFELDRLDLENLTGSAGEHHFNVSVGDGGSDQAAAPHVTLTGLRLTETGEFQLDAASLAGFVYERPDWGVRLDIGAVELPAVPGGHALRHAAGLLSIPEVIVTDARFEVAIPRNDGSGGSSDSILANYGFLDALNGSIGLTIGNAAIPDWASDRIEIDIVNGLVDLDELDDQMIGVLENFIDFDVEGDALVLNLDWGNFHPLPGMIPGANLELARWEPLDDDEVARAEEGGALLSTLVEDLNSGGGGGDPPITVRDIVADLWMAETVVELRDHGRILLGGPGLEAASGITVRGDLAPAGSGITSQIRLGVETIRARVDPDHPLTFGGATVEDGRLRISNVHDTRLDFTGFTPSRLEGEIERAVISGLRVRTP